jgi:single-strand DNA-binding protein
MSKDLNKWMGIGRLGKNPEVRYTANGTACASLSIACGDDYKDKNTGQKVDKTEWVNICAFGRLAEIIGEYVKKGSKIYIEGKFTTRKWQDQNGQDRYTAEIVASEMQMLDSRDLGNAQNVQNPQPAPAPVTNGAAQYQPNANAQPAAGYHSSPQQQGYAPPTGHQGFDYDDKPPF